MSQKSDVWPTCGRNRRFSVINIFASIWEQNAFYSFWMASSGDLKKKRLKKKAVLKSPSGVKRNTPKVLQRSIRVKVRNFASYFLYFLTFYGSTFKHITVIRGRLPAETKIEEKIIRKFMKLARSNEAKKLFEKDPCKIFTDRYILVRNPKI